VKTRGGLARTFVPRTNKKGTLFPPILERKRPSAKPGQVIRRGQLKMGLKLLGTSAWKAMKTGRSRLRDKALLKKEAFAVPD